MASVDNSSIKPQTSFSKAEITYLYATQKQRLNEKYKQIEVEINKIIKLYNEFDDIQSSNDMIRSIVEIIDKDSQNEAKKLRMLAKASDEKSANNNSEKRQEIITNVIQFFDTLDGYLKSNKYSDIGNTKTVATTLEKLRPLMTGGETTPQKGSKSTSKTIADSFMGDVTNLAAGLTEPLALFKINELMKDKLKDGKLSGEDSDVLIKGMQGFKVAKDTRDVTGLYMSDKGLQFNLGITVKEYSTIKGKKDNPYVQMKSRESSFGSVLAFLRPGASTESLYIAQDLQNRIISDGITNFHNRKYAHPFSREFFYLLTTLSKIAIMDLIYAQGDFLNQGIQLAIVNRKAYSIMDMFKTDDPDQLGNFLTKDPYNALATKTFGQTEPDYNTALRDNSKRFDYLNRYSTISLVFKQKISLLK